MKTLKVRLIGTRPLLLHNGQMANPFNPQVQFMKSHTKKRGKTDKDLKDIARMEWEAGLYLNQNGEVSIPARNLRSCFINGAKATKNGKTFTNGTSIRNEAPLKYSGKQIKKTSKEFPSPELNNAFEEQLQNPELIQMVTVQRNKIPRCRPIFDDWSLETEIEYDEKIISEEEVLTAVENAGTRARLGDFRADYGSFNTEKI